MHGSYGGARRSRRRPGLPRWTLVFPRVGGSSGIAAQEDHRPDEANNSLRLSQFLESYGLEGETRMLPCGRQDRRE